MANKEYSTDDLRLRAEAYCARAEHCAYEVRRKLVQLGATASDCDDIIAQLYTGHYIDDMRYCRAYAHDKLLYQHWGKVKIRTMLYAFHLPDQCIAEALSEIDEDEYMRILEHVAAQKKQATREQQVRFLLQRGFDYADIRRAVGGIDGV